ncbi:hypothetical protein [Acaryochloris marina]|uniref:hypothetical protein n=1 Tax=Acaryochloris marina TaxID=155978 RepID=UPI0011D0394C|nr:hypothetical protein [Acaryochloris marina]
MHRFDSAIATTFTNLRLFPKIPKTSVASDDVGGRLHTSYAQQHSTGKSALGVYAMCCRCSLDPFQHQSLFAFGAVKLAFILL